MKNLDYDEISPITGNKCVVVEADEKIGVESRLCMESGYTTTEFLKNDTDKLKEYEASLTQLMLDCKFVDEETGYVWFPTFMQMPGGMLYPAGDTPTDLSWKVAKVVPIIGEERLKYPIPGRENEYYTSKLDVDNATTYDKSDFESALNELYDIVKEAYDNENKLRDNSMQ